MEKLILEIIVVITWACIFCCVLEMLEMPIGLALILVSLGTLVIVLMVEAA